jgi:peroxiredoxin
MKLNRPIYFFLVFSFSTLFISCTVDPGKVFEIEVEDMEEVVVSLEDLRNNDISVLYFLGPECPLCQNYTVSMKAFYEEYKGRNICFYGIFPGKEYSPREINQYMIRFGLEFTSFLDPIFNLTDFLAATTTPEVFVLDKEGVVLYRGAIDNWAIDLSQKRSNITEFYLRDALVQGMEGKPVAKKVTQAVGCFIQ